MEMFLLLIVSVAICIMFGAALGVAAILLMAFGILVGLASVGLVSVSVLVGLYNRSFSSGFRLFLTLVFVIGCAIAGIVLMVTANLVFGQRLSILLAITIGLIAGTTGGLISTNILLRFLRRTLKSYAVNKIGMP